MKQVYKCDYCSFMGTEDEVREHELICIDNYDRKSCFTCIHKKFGRINENGSATYECKAGKEIPEGKYFEFCPKYERKEKGEYSDLVDAMFGGLFG